MRAGGLKRSLEHTFDLTTLDIIRDFFGGSAIDLAANGECSAENLQNGTLEVMRERARVHDTGNADDLVEGDGFRVLDVLFLLSVTRGFLEGFDDQRGSGWHDGDGGLTVLDREFHGHTQTFLFESGHPFGQYHVFSTSQRQKKKENNAAHAQFKRSVSFLLFCICLRNAGK